MGRNQKNHPDFILGNKVNVGICILDEKFKYMSYNGIDVDN